MITVKIDVDGVLADLHPEWLLKYNREFNDSLIPSDITSWGIHQFVKPECGVAIYKYLGDPDLYDNVEPLPDALHAVGWMRDMGFRTVFVTAGIFPAKIQWLGRLGFLNNPARPHDPIPMNDKDIVIASDKSLIIGDVEIDDYPENFSDGKVHILMDQPWNRDYIGDAFRVYRWMEAMNLLGALNMQRILDE